MKKLSLLVLLGLCLVACGEKKEEAKVTTENVVAESTAEAKDATTATVDAVKDTATSAVEATKDAASATADAAKDAAAN